MKPIEPNSSTFTSTSDEQSLKDLSQTQRDLISIYLKEVLVSLQFVLPNQLLRLTFQGKQYQFELGTSWKSSTTNSLSLKNSTENQENPNRNLNLTLCVYRGTKILIKRGSGVSKSSNSNQSQANSNDGQQENSTELSTDKVVEQIELEGENGKEDSEAWAYASLAGLEKQVEEVRKLVEMPLRRPELFQRYGEIGKD